MPASAFEPTLPWTWRGPEVVALAGETCVLLAEVVMPATMEGAPVPGGAK